MRLPRQNFIWRLTIFRQNTLYKSSACIICLVLRGRSHFVEWMVGSFEKQDMHFADLSRRDEVKNSIWGFPIFCACNPEIEDVFVTWQVSCIKQQKKSMSNTKLYLSLFLSLKVSTERQQITAPKNTKKLSIIGRMERKTTKHCSSFTVCTKGTLSLSHDY